MTVSRTEPAMPISPGELPELDGFNGDKQSPFYDQIFAKSASLRIERIFPCRPPVRAIRQSPRRRNGNGLEVVVKFTVLEQPVLFSFPAVGLLNGERSQHASSRVDEAAFEKLLRESPVLSA